ncbi:hypothetical protein ACJ41O_006132 [Fusarium nematophilum]
MRKRATAGAEPGSEASVRRSKRGKYTAVACDECKKRKLKCIAVGDANCERCIAGGLVCVFGSGPATHVKDKREDHEISQLKQQVADLVGVVMDLKDIRDLKPQPPSQQQQQQQQQQQASTVSPHSRETVIVQSPASTHRGPVPKQPQFVGPTRSAFGILVGERSLNRMGIPAFEESQPPSGPQSPAGSTGANVVIDLGHWDRCTAGEVAKFLVVFQEEVESVYPFIDMGEYIMQSQEILAALRAGVQDDSQPGLLPGGLTIKDVEIARVAIATGMVIESHGKNELSAAIVESVEYGVSCILTPQVELKEIQLITMLSIYYFHCDDELLAWRTIGIAARECLEMGLHRKRSLHDNFKDPDSRNLATRVFWCVYVLDRRWSFGTSLSFALIDKDIDPELPKPVGFCHLYLEYLTKWQLANVGQDDEYSYLKCMVGYGKLCSKLWDAIPPFGSASQAIPDDTAMALDLSTQDWLESIPPHLQLRHPRLGLAPRSQPRHLHRLRALLYLRGNYARILIYRHHLMSAASIAANPSSAWLVVDIAQDTIQVLVHLHETSDIYSRQQNAFNYFLLSGLAIIFLAVCHAPVTFAAPCRKIFLEAADLVKGLSRNSIISRRLWKSIRGLIPRMKSLSLQHLENQQLNEPKAVDDEGAAVPVTHGVTAGEDAADFTERVPVSVPGNDAFHLDDMMLSGPDIANSVPDMYQMRDDLLSLFDAFGQGQQLLHQLGDAEDLVMLNDEGGEIARRFQGLI